jgi:hypothetical protein
MKSEKVLILRSCAPDLTSHGGFHWPESGPVSCPDWSPAAECGNGLHGWLWGVGDGGLGDYSEGAKWLVASVDKSSIIDLVGKVKFPSCDVVFCGDMKAAAKYIAENGAPEGAIIGGTATAGYSGTATAGYRGTATAGYRGTATAGYSGTATAGDRGTATAGYRGTATAGVGGVISILRWNGKRYRSKIATIKDEDGDGDLMPNTKYRLNGEGEFVEVEA